MKNRYTYLLLCAAVLSTAVIVWWLSKPAPVKTVVDPANKISETIFHADPEAEGLLLENELFNPEIIQSTQGLKIYPPSENYPAGLVLMATGAISSITALTLELDVIFSLPYMQQVNGQSILMADAVKLEQDVLAFTSFYGHHVAMFDSNGALIRKLGQKGDRKGEFNLPIGIDVTSDGRLVVADYGNSRIQVFNPDWEPELVFGKSGSKPGETEDAYDVCLKADEIFLSDRENNRVQVFTVDGRLKRLFKIEPDEQYIPLSFNQHCDFDSQGNLYLADTYNRRVVVFGNNEKLLKTFTFHDFGVIRGLAIGPDDKIYITGMKKISKPEKYANKNAGIWVFEPVVKKLSNQHQSLLMDD